MTKTFEKIGQEIGQLVDEKNRSYGDSFRKCGEFLRLLYPNGIQPEQYQDMLGLVRVFDKQMRIATNKDAFGENAWEDICGYAILGVELNQKPKSDDAPIKQCARCGEPVTFLGKCAFCAIRMD